MTLSGKDVANEIASLAWKATGYRFTYAASSTLLAGCGGSLKKIHSFYSSKTSNGSQLQYNYRSCQARGTAYDRDKVTTVGEEMQRAVRRMDRFECNWGPHITSHEGIANVEITHQESHKSNAHACPSQWCCCVVHTP
jgi:hypothetical protein